jgi:hypothetical protein
MELKTRQLLKFHVLLFLLVVTGSFSIAGILTTYNAWDFLAGLMDLSVLGSFQEFIEWFPNWGGILFFLVTISKVVLLFQGLKLVFAEWRRWQLIEGITADQTRLKRDATQGIFWSLGLLIGYILGWELIAVLELGGERALETRILFSRGFLVQLGIQLLLYIRLNRDHLKAAWSNFIFEPSLPYNLAILRILFFGYLLFVYSAKLSTVLPIVGLQNRESLPFIGWLVHIMPVSPSLYTIMAYIGMAAAVGTLLGWKTRFFAVVNAITIFYVMATPNFFGKLWHEQLVIWLSWIMALSPMADVWSIDARLKKQQVKRSASYSWPVKVIWLHFGLIYFWAGFYKIWDAGFDWALSKSMVSQVQLEWVQHYDKVPDIRIDQHPLLLHFGGILVICFELFFPLFIIVRNWRWIGITGGLIMHNLLGYFIYISFFHFLQVFYVFLIDFNRLFVKKEINEVEENRKDWKVKLAILILVLNLFAGMFNVNSYPFSAYPKYSAIIPEKITFIRFNGESSGFNCFEIAKRNQFRWEDYGWLEYEIIQLHESGKKVTSKVADYWQIWKSKVPDLQHCAKVVVELCERPVSPESKDQVVVIDTLAILTD